MAPATEANDASLKYGIAGRQQVEHIEDSHKVQATLDEALIVTEADEKMNSYTYVLASVAAVSGLLFGYDTGVISAALVNIGTDLGHELNSIETEWIGAATSCGALIGALGAGPLADIIGRKWVLAVGDMFFVLGAVIIAASYSLIQILIGRVVLGFGVGIAACVGPMYITELAPTRFRGTLVTIQSIMITAGQAVSYAIGAGMTFHSGWRALFGISIAPAVFQALFVHFYLPESPRYDLLHSNVDKARRTLTIVYSSATDAQIELKLAALQDTVATTQVFLAKYTLRQRFTLLTRDPQLRRITIVACGLMLFQQMAGNNTLMYYSGTIFKAAGFNNPIATGLILACVNFAFTGVSMYMCDRLGKRTALIIGYPLMIIGHALTAMASAFMTKSTGGKLVEGTDYPKNWANLMLGMIILFFVGYSSSIGNLAWHGSELFPLELRGLGASILTATCWSFNILVSASFLSMMDGIGGGGTFGFYTAICLMGLLFVLFCYPETSGLPLEDAQSLFENGFGIRKSRRLRARRKAIAEQGPAAAESGGAKVTETEKA